MKYRAPRLPCDFPVVVTTRRGQTEARIVNVSQQGARVSGVPGLAPGEALRLDLGPCTHPRLAEVRWSAGACAGVQFATCLNARDLSLIRRTATCSAPARNAGWNLHLRELR